MVALRTSHISRSYWLKKLFVLIAAVAALAVAWRGIPASAQTESSLATGSVVAVVNADPISRDSLADAAVERYGVDVLDNMVNRYLILQRCQASGVEITNDEVGREIQRLAKKFGLTIESYLTLLRDERDITPDQYSREIIWPMLALRRLVADQVEVSQEEFNQAFLSQYGEAVKCRIIMVDDAGLASQLQVRAASEPERFETLAKQHSQDESSASVGGLIPPIRRYMGDSRIEDAAFSLLDGGVSNVLQIGDQHMILQAVKRIPATQPSPKAMPSIREQIQDRIRDTKMRVAAAELFTELQSDANVITVLGNETASAKYPGVAAIINGQQIPVSSVAAECVKRHGAEVLDGEINRKLLNQALRAVRQTVSQSDIDAEVRDAAIRYGFVRSDGSPDIGAWIEAVVADSSVSAELYIQDAVWPSVALKKLVAGTIEVTDQDMQRGFESSFGPRVEVLAIVLSDQRSAQEVWEMARDNPTDAFFGTLAEDYSIEPVSASNAGKVPPIRKFGGQPAVEKEAFSLKPGELSGIISTGDQYIILRCQGYTEPIVSDVQAVATELRRDLTEKATRIAMAAKFDELLTSAEIDNFFAAESQVPRVARQSASSAK